MRGLVVERVAFFIEVAVLEHGNPLAQGALELKHTWKLLIETFGLFHAFDVGPKRFSQIDCGEHLHDGTYDVPTVPGDVPVSVGDIRHRGFKPGRCNFKSLNRKTPVLYSPWACAASVARASMAPVMHRFKSITVLPSLPG